MKNYLPEREGGEDKDTQVSFTRKLQPERVKLEHRRNKEK